MTIRHTLRSLKRTPIFTIAMLLSLVLGTASVGSMFAVVHGVLLAPLAYGDPDRLVRVGLSSTAVAPAGETSFSVPLTGETAFSVPPTGETSAAMQQPPAVFFLYQRLARRLRDIGFYRTGNANIWTSGDGDQAERVAATWVSASVVPLLQVPPLLGRAFTADETRTGGAGAVILSESVWRSRFHAAPDVIGKTLMVNSVAREVVGVMPAQFAFPTPDTRVWLPVRPESTVTVGDFSYSGIARLAPGATAELAQRELSGILSKLAESFPRLESSSVSASGDSSSVSASGDSGAATATWLAELAPTPVVTDLRAAMTGSIARPLWLLAAASGLVLLVAWANVVNLMLIRSDGRQLELGVRAAIGASRLRNATHFFGESVLLGVCAGVLALLLTYGAVRALVAFGPSDVPRLAELGLDASTAGFMLLITTLAVLVSGTVPALRVHSSSLAKNLCDGARGASAGKSRQHLRAGITIVQIALALVVSLGSALLLRTAHRLYAVHPGFDANQVTIIWTQLPFARYDDAAAVAFYARLSDRVRQLATVRAVGLTMQVPLTPGETLQQTIKIDGERTQSLPVNVVDHGYFAAMRMPLLAGSNFRASALERGQDIIISQRTAMTLFGHASPDPSAAAVGKRVALAPSGPTYTIIGVVGDVRARDLAIAPSLMLYRPQVVPIDATLEPAARRTMALVVRSSTAPDAIVPTIRQIVRALDPSVPIFNVQTLQGVVQSSTARRTLALTLTTAAAAITLLLGMIGLYGVMAYMVALRNREFGVRIALGANRSQITRWVALRGIALTASGVALGFVFYALAAPFSRAFIFGVTTADPVLLVGTTFLVLVTASLASWLPARRAARIDPLVALRAE